jgi:hypothetical protein
MNKSNDLPAFGLETVIIGRGVESRLLTSLLGGTPQENQARYMTSAQGCDPALPLPAYILRNGTLMIMEVSAENLSRHAVPQHIALHCCARRMGRSTAADV